MKKRERSAQILCFGFAVNSRIHWFTFAIIFLFIGNAHALSADIMLMEPFQSVITGTVTDEAGVPLPGANVIEKGTTNGVVTDFDGNYSIEISDQNAILGFSSLGFLAVEVPVGSNTTINATLKEDAQNLEEVVVVGYGTQQKEDVTGSLSQVDGEALTIAPPPNLSAALSGQLSGVIAVQTSGQPGQDNAQFQIRGRSTLGNNNPLVLIDGVERPFQRVNPFEVASVTALKDAASTAVYGSRAANGVLLVTTNRGRAGKPTINFSSQYGWQSPTRRPDLMNASQYVLAFRQSFLNRGTAPDALPFDDLVADAEAGTLTSYDWWNETLKNSAPQQQYNFSVNGGNERLRYFFSYGFLDQGAFYENAGFKQSSIRSNVDADITDRLKFRLNVAGRLENTLRSADNDSEIFSNALRANPLFPVFVDGLPGAEGLPPNSLGFDGFSGNSVGDANRNGSDKRDSDYFQTNFQLEYDIPWIEGLSAKAMYSYDRNISKRKSFFTPYISYQRNEADGQLIPNVSDNLSFLDESRGDFTQQTTQLSLSYKKEFENHSISVLGLFEQIEQKSDVITAFRDGFISPAIQELFAGNVGNDQNGGQASETARRGYVGRIDYGFKNRYLFQANLRLDQSYIFPKENRNGYFPAFSAGWRISEEAFMVDSEFITDLKLRGSWGITGNDRVNPFQFTTGFGFDGGYVSDGIFLPGISPSGIPNPNITWETATTTDIGLEAEFLNGKWGLEVDYYTKRTEDILAQRSLSVPGTFGAQLPSENIGIVDSWGWEFTATHKNTIGDNFYYNIDANLTLARNEIVFIDEPEGVLPGASLTGKEIGVRVGFVADGLFQNQAEIDNAATQFGELAPGDIRYVDINGDGVVNQDDRQAIGSSNTPGLIYGLNMDFGFKGLRLAFNFQGATDYTREVEPRGFLLDVGNNFAVLTDSWTVDNPDARYPRILPDGNTNNNQTSTFWVEEVSFLRLRRAQISYDFSSVSEKLEDIGVKNLSLNVSGTNLLTFTNISLGDPEGTEGNSLFYPISRVVSVGLNIGF
ncbi:TonB-dependent receptor [Aggregatimonas sangjinii]|uniref:TonB-dependent receptor n=1 Tax=Aggregatimonas sangjinii TaxID=2583587 RepID=A0A5B7SS30_9FLAO|nr:TonB-dependent receptor [Aggregatimonas sangjinii]QCW99483.1 TonB-dependent receptor [Aggregatimonas sangjinii]